MDHTMTLVVDQDRCSPAQSSHLIIKAEPSATFEFEHDETKSPVQEDAQMVEPGEVCQQEDIATPTITAPACDFPLFSKLPAELRLMIWKAALPGPRLVDANFQFEDSEFPFGSDLVSCTTRTPPPAMLGVCHESRAEALKRYNLCFATEVVEATTYFDLNADTLLIACHDSVNLLSSLNVSGRLRAPPFQGLRHLALGLHPDGRNIDPMDYMFLMDHLRGLETFTIMPHERHNCGAAWEDVDLREVESENEPTGYRDRYNAVMEDETLWMPGKWQKAPLLKFMAVSRASAVNFLLLTSKALISAPRWI